MPLIQRPEWNLMRFYQDKLVDVLINPVNCLGVMGAGIAEEFKNLFPKMFDDYEKVCRSKDGLKIGQIVVSKDDASQVEIVCLPTKRHFSDDSDIAEIRKGLLTFREWLLKPENKTKIVAMPMLGCGLGKLGYEKALPAFIELLDDLPNNIYLSMAPNKMEVIPQYFGIIGPRAFGRYKFEDGSLNKNYQEERDYIADGLKKAMAHWGKDPRSFIWVSGGAVGVDEAGCGDGKTEESFSRSLCCEYAGADSRPIIFLPDWKRFGDAAAFLRNRNIADLINYVLVVKPPGVPAIGTSHTLRMILDANKALLASGEDKNSTRYKHVVVKGSTELDTKPAKKRITL